METSTFKITKESECPHCGNDKNIRNPTGWCDHLYYPEYCKTCKAMGGMDLKSKDYDMEDKMFACPNCGEYDLCAYGDTDYLPNIQCLSCKIYYIAHRIENLHEM